MNERVMQFRVGVMVVATVFITAFLVVMFNGFPSFVEGNYTVYVDFPSAPGIAVGTPVLKSGITIGRVTKVRFAEDVDPQYTGVIVTLEIDANRKLHRNEQPQISQKLLGDTFIEFVRQPAGPVVPVKQPEQPETYQPGEMMRGRVSSDALQAIGQLEGNLATTMQSMARTSDEIGLLARRVNDLLRSNDEQLVRIVNKAETALDQINAAASSANDLIGNPQLRDNVMKVSTELPQVLERLNQAVSSMRQTFESADRNLRNVEGLTKPLGERGSQLIGNIEVATENINRLVDQLNTFATALNTSNGTLGQLINDPKLYQQISETLANVNCLMQELKPIMRDVRAFSDKVSRHPEVLGVRGAIRPSSGIK